VTAPTLVAVAHGSRSPHAAAATGALLAEVRRRRPGLAVQESYLDHGEPGLAHALSRVTGPRVVVPLLLGAAYHSEVDVPAAVADAGAGVVQADVLGPDPHLLDALERRLAEAGVRPGDPGTAVVLAAAGSTGAGSVAAVRSLAADWAAAGWWEVQPAYASVATPTVRDAVGDLRRAGAPRVAVASYLLFPGRFADRVASAGADVTSAPLAAAPEVADLVLARYDAAAARQHEVAVPLLR
jgi:sirohydrochlorin ferrochelatase